LAQPKAKGTRGQLQSRARKGEKVIGGTLSVPPIKPPTPPDMTSNKNRGLRLKTLAKLFVEDNGEWSAATRSAIAQCLP
jgi:hypothetical protein